MTMGAIVFAFKVNRFGYSMKFVISIDKILLYWLILKD